LTQTTGLGFASSSVNLVASFFLAANVDHKKKQPNPTQKWRSKELGFPKAFLRFEQYTSPKQYHRKRRDEKKAKQGELVLEKGLKRIKNNHEHCDLPQGFSDELRSILSDVHGAYSTLEISVNRRKYLQMTGRPRLESLTRP
jgi:hypothetical protein